MKEIPLLARFRQLLLESKPVQMIRLVNANLSKNICWATNTIFSRVQSMGVNHRRANILVLKEFLESLTCPRKIDRGVMLGFGHPLVLMAGGRLFSQKTRLISLISM